VRSILFCKQAVYGERNSEIVRPIRAYGFVREHESISRHSRATATTARGNYHDRRTCCGKGGAECCHRLYHTDGLAGTDSIFVGAILRTAAQGPTPRPTVTPTPRPTPPLDHDVRRSEKNQLLITDRSNVSSSAKKLLLAFFAVDRAISEATEPESASCDSTQGNPECWRVEKDQRYENI
jgi:hypothetical protein